MVIVLTLQACGPYLVEKGKTDFIIVTSDSPSLVDQTAAKELKMYLDMITGINWTIASEKDVPEDASQILVGNSRRVRKFFPEIDPDRISYDGIEIHLKGNKLLLTGHEQRGTLYAVNTFLEEALGVRWWTSTEQTIPAFKNFRLKPLNISYAPKLIYREAYYKDAYDSVFTTRMKCNGSGGKIAPEYGDYHRFTYFVHSFYQLIPPEKYFAAHPEWFSEINGVRDRGYDRVSQLCLTNDEMRKELTKNALEALRKNPGSKFISISQNDGEGGFCTCEKCNEVVEEEGEQSGPLIRFVNAVAEEIGKEFPDVFVETLGYGYTRKPPKYAKPHENVVVRFCTIECSFVQPLSGEQNQTFYDDMMGWSKITKHLFVWDYVTNFYSYILPHPNLRVLAPNIRLFVDHGTIGLFEQGDVHCPVGDFVRMRNWVISKLMWNPMLDENELIREFLLGYYGKKATPYLLAYFDLLLNKAESTGKFISSFNENTDSWLDYETLCKATSLFDKAIAAAEKENIEFVSRLLRERLPLEHVWLKGYHKFKRDAEKQGVNFLGPADPAEALKSFFEMLDHYQVTSYREAGGNNGFENYKLNMLYRFGKPAPAPDEYINLDINSWVDIQEYDFMPIYGWSTLVYVEDSTASNGRVVRMPGGWGEWMVKVPFDYLFESHALFNTDDADTKFKIVVYARCDATVNDGLGMICSVYDHKAKKEVTHKQVDVSVMVGSAYQKIEFEPIPLTKSMYIQFSPPDRRGEVRWIYIDRILIIKENAPASYPTPEIKWNHSYHQTLMMKILLSTVESDKGEEKQLKTRDKGESRVIVNFEQALEIIRKMDHLTLGIPKIVYLVGWQYNGHDSKYPAWGEVNPKLKRPQDKTALESMKWLMAEAFKYNTTVSVHINMFDAYDDSPLWDTYVENNIIARNTDGSLRYGQWGWPISYTQEWKTGYAQKRIDAICDMLPLAKAGTVHIDAFHTLLPLTPEVNHISPYLGFTAEQEAETQVKIFHYWASKGIDVTSEGAHYWLRLSAFQGLQPAAWWYSPSAETYMKWPASYYCGGTSDNEAGLLFGRSMHGEDLINKDPQQLSGFLQQFCTQTLPWYYLNRFQRLEYIKTDDFQEVHFSGGLITRLADKEYTIVRDGDTILHNGDVFVPALWMEVPAIIAYSTNGYDNKTWQLPNDWNKYSAIDLYRLTLDGIELFQQKTEIKEKMIRLSLRKDEALLLIPADMR